MAQSLYTLKGIYYVAGRSFVLNGKQVTAGDVVEGAHELRNIESFVRSRHLIPVVDDHNDVPVYYQKDVKLASLVEQKFQLKIKHPKKAEPPKAEKKVEPAPAKKAVPTPPAKKAAAPKKDENDA